MAIEMIFELGFERLLDLMQELAGQSQPVVDLALAARHQAQDLQPVHRNRLAGLVMPAAAGAEHAAEQW